MLLLETTYHFQNKTCNWGHTHLSVGLTNFSTWSKSTKRQGKLTRDDLESVSQAAGGSLSQYSSPSHNGM